MNFRLFRPLTALLLLLAGHAQAAPKPEPWPKWEAHDEASVGAVSHEPWERFLASYVKTAADGINRVAYKAVTPASRKGLADYLTRLQAVPIRKYARAEQRAYWINLYNAQTVMLILAHPEAKGIRDIKLGGLFSGGPWDGKLLKVEGEPLSLNDIEHRILRPIWRDPRTHYAVNCASLGCPNLQARAFAASNMESLLDAAARSYINHPRGASVAKGKLKVSTIYEWFKDDFGGSDAGVIAHLKKYAEPPLAAALKDVKKIDGDSYDWSLNGV